ncbi:hypothetical protein ACW6G5_004676 [Pseudomonas aeruginosa]
MNRSHIIEALRAADWSNTPNGNLALIRAAIEHLEAQPSSAMGRVPDAVVEPKSRYIHRNGVEYEVVMIANGESTNLKYPPTIVYRGVANGKVWARPACDWDRSMQLVERPAPAKVEGTEQVSSTWLAQLRSEYRQFAEVAEKRQAKLQSALARVAELETALEPFAAVADAYDDSEDDDHEPYTDMGCDDRLRLTLGQHRAGRIALEGRTPQAQAQHSVPEEFIGRLSEFLAQRGATGKALLRELRDMLAAAPGNSAQHSVPDGYRLIRLEHFAAIKAQLNPEQVDAYRGRNIYDEDKVYANWNACRSALDEIKDVFQQIDWDAENELAELLAAAPGKEGA